MNLKFIWVQMHTYTQIYFCQPTTSSDLVCFWSKRINFQNKSSQANLPPPQKKKVRAGQTSAPQPCIRPRPHSGSVVIVVGCQLCEDGSDKGRFTREIKLNTKDIKSKFNKFPFPQACTSWWECGNNLKGQSLNLFKFGIKMDIKTRTFQLDFSTLFEKLKIAL